MYAQMRTEVLPGSQVFCYLYVRTVFIFIGPNVANNNAALLETLLFLSKLLYYELLL